MPDWKILRRWYKQSPVNYQYYSRVVRAVIVRMLLHWCKVVCRIEQYLHPIRRADRKRILVIVIGGMGDCLLFDTLFRRLKERWPDVCIDVFTGGFEQMWARMESVDNLILFKPTKFKSPWAYTRLFRTLYRRSYDIVAEGIAMVPKRGIYPLLTSFVMQASTAPVRIGRKNTGRMEALRPRRLDFIGHAEMAARKKNKLDLDINPFLSHTISVPPPHGRALHESAYIFEPLGLTCYRRVDEPTLLAQPDTDQWAQAMLRKQWGTPNDILIAMTVETTRQIKAWPMDAFMRVVEKGVQDNYKFVVLGLDRDRAAEICRCFPGDAVINLAGRTDLDQMIALIGQCDVFLSCDTGPAHIAQACRIPTVVLFGPSNEKEFGPKDTSMHYLIVPSETLSCRPCVLGPCVRGTSCIQLIQPDTVYQALMQAVAQAHRLQGNHQLPGPRKQPPLCLCEI